MASSPEEKEATIAKLLRGEESATELKTLILQALKGSQSLEAKAGILVDEILGSISWTRAVLGSAGTAVDVKQESAATQALSDDRRSENSTRKRKIQPTARDRRGGCRRRGNPYSCRTTLSNTTEDGHTWRKYGQKEIFSAKYPRSYFRCTHKFLRGCQAVRQVQRSEEDPSKYVIIYMGEHTCNKDATKASQFTTASHPRTPRVINFGSNTAEEEQENPFSTFPPMKQESDEEVLSSLTPGTSSSEHFASPELPEFEGFMSLVNKIVGPSSDHGEATSLPSSIGSPDIFLDLGDIPDVDQDELFRSLIGC